MPTTTWGLPRSAGPAGLISARVADVLAFAQMHLCRRSRSRRHARALVGERRGDDREAGRAPRHADARRLVGSRLDPVRLGRRAAHRPRRLDARAGSVPPRSPVARPRRLAAHERRPCDRSLARAPAGGLRRARGRGDAGPDRAGRHVGRRRSRAPTSGATSARGSRPRCSRATRGSSCARRSRGRSQRSCPSRCTSTPLAPVEPGVFAIRAPGTTTWIAVTFYALADGARYVHYGARANPLVVGVRQVSMKSDTERKESVRPRSGRLQGLPRRRRGSSGGIRLCESRSQEDCAGARSPSGAHAMHGRRREAPPGSCRSTSPSG